MTGRGNGWYPRCTMAKKAIVSIVGAGNVATALARALRQRGYKIDEIIARDRADSLRRARSLARTVGAHAASIERACFAAGVIWICVTDDAIASVATQLACRRD